MERIYSNITKTKLLFLIYRNDNEIRREDLSNPAEYLQCAVLNLDKGDTFRPHKHKFKSQAVHTIAQESWVILSGKVKFFMYDTNDKLLKTVILNKHDVCMTFYGGHTYEIMEENTKIVEMKVGPYFGQEQDKEFINVIE